MIAVVIPCYRVREHILGVLAAIGPECGRIYVVDDRCPSGTGRWVEAECRDARVKVLYHEENQGVGGATVTGYRAAIADGAEVIVKLDGDGQMDPRMIPRLVRPILDGEADYAKGNRFFELSGLRAMPAIRLLGNTILSFASKLSSGYWHLFDPTNGFTAIHGAVAAELPLELLSRRWYFESDILFRLGILRAVVCDVPIPAFYGDEHSSLVIRQVFLDFAVKHLLNTIKRIFYSYFLRNFNVASLEILAGPALLIFGFSIGVVRWLEVARTGIATTSGTVMLAALPIILGTQLLLAFLSFDLQNIPREVLHRRLVHGHPASPGEHG